MFHLLKFNLIKFKLIVSVVYLSSLFASCVTTKQEGDLMRADIAELNNRMLEVNQNQQAATAKDQEKIRALEAKLLYLEQRQKIILQNSANGGVKVEQIIAEMQSMQGELEEARQALGETKKSVLETNKTIEGLLAGSAIRLEKEVNHSVQDSGTDSKVNSKSTKKTVEEKKSLIEKSRYPKKKKELYDFAYAFYKAKKYHEAIDAMRYFIEKNPSDKTLVDNAYYWKGDAYFQLAKQEQAKQSQKTAQNYFKKALLAYQEVMRMDNSDKEDGALYKSGQIFEALGFKEAPVFYEELIKNHKKSPLVHKAKKRLKAIKK